MSYLHGCKQTPTTPPTTTDEDSSGNTSDDETKKKKGNRAMGKKKYPKAIKYYTKAMKLAPENPTYRLNRAIANAALELWKDAEADAESAVQLGKPATSKSHYQLARAKLRRGFCDEAQTAVKVGIAAFPGEAALLQLEKEINRELSQRKAKEKKRREAEATKPAQTQGPGGARALLEQARAAYSGGRSEEVITLCKGGRQAALSALASAAPGSTEADTARREEMSLLSLSGKACMVLRRWPEAGEAYQGVVELEEALFSMDNKDEREALSNAYNNWGIALKNQGRFNEAVDAMNKSYQRSTNGDDAVATEQAAQILQNVGQCLRAQKKISEARKIFERALEITQRLAGPEHCTTALGHLLVARCLRDEGNIKAAITSYMKVVEIFESKEPEECLQEMPELPNKDKLVQVQNQAKNELAQLIMMVEQARQDAAGGSPPIGEEPPATTAVA